MTSARPVNLDDLFCFKQLSDVQISPDGALIAFVAGDSWKERDRVQRRQVWVVPRNGGSARPFTSGPRADHTPRWSPDGARLAFLSDRAPDGKTRIYLLDRAGGEAQQLGELPGEPSDLAWSPDGARLAFLMEDADPDAQRRSAGDDAIVYEGRHRWQRLWTLDVASGAARALTGEIQVWEFGWAPDGGFALVVGPEPYEWSWFVARLARIGPDGGAEHRLFHLPGKQLGCPRVSPDGTQVAWLSCAWSDRGPNGGDVQVMPLAGGEPRTLTSGYNGSVWWLQWTPDGAKLDFLAYEEGDAAVGRIDVATGAWHTRWRGQVAFDVDYLAGHLAADGTLAVIRSDPVSPPDVWRAEATTDDRRPTTPNPRPPAPTPLSWRQLTHLHPQAAELALGETRVLHWRGADGLPIQGLLILPVGYVEGRRVPLITWVHGGPAALSEQMFYCGGRLPQQLFAGAGFAVLLPNPRGSTGWGVPFTESNTRDLGGQDFLDIMAGIDEVIGQGIADPARLSIGGWSYGGFMSAWAITQTTRFKAAVVGAAIINWRSFHGVASIAAWDRLAYCADPYELGGAFDRFSPLSFVARAAAPALILHGADDIIVPVGQSYEFFRGLKDHGKAAELVVYPREGHSLRERLHLIDRHRRCLEWFQRTL